MLAIKPNVFYVGTIDWDRTLFDELIALPGGTTYNSYLIKGSEKTALIDTVHPSSKDELLGKLRQAGVKVDYIIANHGEQDHSGSIPYVLEMFPEAKVVTNNRCKPLLMDALLIPADRFIEVTEGDKLSLGDKTLQFVLTPWVHWPDTMATYLVEDKVLFTCDFLGSHLATSHLLATNEPEVLDAAKRYYAEIMMPFRPQVRKNLAKVQALAPTMIAPSHGPIYTEPSFILKAYDEWSSDETKQEVIIPYVSMYESTAQMVKYLTARLMDKGVAVRPYNVVTAEPGEIIKATVDASTIVFASPTVLVGAHPTLLYIALLVNAFKPKTKFASIIGSYGWGSRMPEQIQGVMTNMKVEWADPVLVKGLPKQADYEALDRLAEAIYRLNAGKAAMAAGA